MGMVGIIDALNIPPIEDFAQKARVRRAMHACSTGVARAWFRVRARASQLTSSARERAD